MSIEDMTNCSYIPLPEVLSFIVDNRGKTVPTAKTGIPLIATNCIKNNELYPVFEKIRYLSKDTYKNWFRAHPIPGDIIFVNKGAPGRVCLVPDPVGFCIAQDMMAFRVNDKIVNNKYLFAVLRSPQFQTQIEQFHVGTLIPHFKKGDLDKLLIPIPSIEIQKFIGETYYALCNKIELNNRINKTLEEMAQAIFKSWFVDFEFPNEDGRPYKSSGGEMMDSELGKIPEGWHIFSLSEIFEINPSRRIPRGTIAPYLDMSNIPTRGHAPNNWIEREIGSGMKFINGDTLVARITPCLENGKTAYVDFLEDGQVGWGSTEYIILRPRSPMSTVFAYILARSDRFRDYAIKRMTGSSGRQRVPVDNIGLFKIVLPPLEHVISKSFAVIIESLFNCMRISSQESRTINQIRDSLLPKLMSGEIRVPIEEVQ